MKFFFCPFFCVLWFFILCLGFGFLLVVGESYVESPKVQIWCLIKKKLCYFVWHVDDDKCRHQYGNAQHVPKNYWTSWKCSKFSSIFFFQNAQSLLATMISFSTFFNLHGQLKISKIVHNFVKILEKNSSKSFQTSRFFNSQFF
jgi:hypothetical protein